MEQKKQLPIGKIDFREFFSEDAPLYFVDKTPFIKELVETSLFSSSANLILRPRRFGKTLALSMLQNFFDLDAKEARPFFERLEIGKDKAFCDKYENRFPVISITFKDVKGSTMEEMLDALNSNLAGEYIRHAYAADMAENALEKERYARLKNGKGTFDDFKQYLALLSKALYLKNKVKPLVFIDEYDVPLNDAHQHGFFDAFVSVISGMFSSGLKDNLYVKGAVITGCLQIAKNQIFTGLNNPAVYPVTDPTFAQYFGFTKEETAELLHYYGLDSRMDDVRDNYDGYSMGQYSIYNPFSLVNFVKRAVGDKDAPCDDYWSSTSGNALLWEMLESCKENEELREMFEKLLSGGPVERITIDSTIVYSTMKESTAAIMGTLLFSGYLTVVKNEGNDVYTLRIPNKEVLSTFKGLVRQYNERLNKQAVPYLVEKFIDGDIENAQTYINDLLCSVLVVRDKDTSENNFHYFLAAILAMTKVSRWEILSQDQGRKGFADFAIVGTNNKAIIIEEKVAKDVDEVDKLYDEGARQIETNAYAEKYEKLHYKLYKYVIVYLDMRANIKKV
jgi:hypothetical protein